MSGGGVNLPSEDLERARRESRHCATCGGTGLVVVFHPRWRGLRVDRVWCGELDDEGKQVLEPVALEVAAHCVCSLGRWMRERTEQETRDRIPDVEAIFDGRSRWLLEAPEPTRRPIHAA